MSDDHQSPNYRLDHAIGSGLPLRDTADRPDPGDTMAESLRCTARTLPGLNTFRAGANDDTALQEARLQMQQLQ